MGYNHDRPEDLTRGHSDLQMKIAPGYASLPACRRGERHIDRNQTTWKSSRLLRVIVACNPAHPVPSALRTSNGPPIHACMLEAMRTQGFPKQEMRITIRIILLALFIPAAAFAQNQRLKSPSEIAREQSKSVVIIEALDERGSVIGQGSGFIVTSQGAVVTNLHVVQGASSLRVKLPGGDAYKTPDLVDVDEAKDLAIVKIKGFKLPAVMLGDSDKAETGEPVVAISSPEGLVNSISTGVLRGVRRFETHRVFQITAPISQGSSGGALFNSSGEVIGVITYLLKSGQNINFAVPINYARGMIGDQPSKTLADLR